MLSKVKAQAGEVAADVQAQAAKVKSQTAHLAASAKGQASDLACSAKDKAAAAVDTAKGTAAASKQIALDVKRDMGKKELPGEPIFVYGEGDNHCAALAYFIKRKHILSAVFCPSKYDPFGRCRRSFILVNRLLLLFAISTLPWSDEVGIMGTIKKAIITVFIVIPISIPLDKMVQCTKPPEHEVRGIADQRSAFVKRLSGFCLCLARVCFYPVTILLSLICIAAAVLAYRNKCDPVTGDCSKAVNLVGVWLLAIVLDWVNQIPTIVLKFYFPYPWCQTRKMVYSDLDLHKRRYSLEEMSRPAMPAATSEAKDSGGDGGGVAVEGDALDGV